MRTSGVANDAPLTVVVFVVALVFLVLLAGGPSEFMHAVQHVAEPVVSSVVQFFHGAKT
jgi:hypothetical protein